MTLLYSFLSFTGPTHHRDVHGGFEVELWGGGGLEVRDGFWEWRRLFDWHDRANWDVGCFR